MRKRVFNRELKKNWKRERETNISDAKVKQFSNEIFSNDDGALLR